MLSAMNPERTRHERYIEYTAALREGFVSGLLSELQPLNQWVVWKGGLEDGKRKKVPYNPNYHLTRATGTITDPQAAEIIKTLHSYIEASVAR